MEDENKSSGGSDFQTEDPDRKGYEGGPKVTVYEMGTGSDRNEQDAYKYVEGPNGQPNGPYIGSTYPDNPKKKGRMRPGEHKYEVVDHDVYGRSLFFGTVKADGLNKNHDPPDNLIHEVFDHRVREDLSGKQKGSGGCPTTSVEDTPGFYGNFEVGQKGTYEIIDVYWP